MKQFEQIEKEFFEINEDNDSSFVKYYYDTEDYFVTIDISDKEIGQKNLWMLSEIINSAYKQKDYDLLKKIVKSTITKFKEYSLLHNYDLKADTFYKSMIFNVAIDNFNNKKYYLAKKYFEASVFLDKDNFRLIDFYNVSKYKFARNMNRIIGLTGLTILIIKYFLKLVLGFNGFGITVLGIPGAILLITYAVISSKIKSPATNTRS